MYQQPGPPVNNIRKTSHGWIVKRHSLHL
jgi:hypothetical protein